LRRKIAAANLENVVYAGDVGANIQEDECKLVTGKSPSIYIYPTKDTKIDVSFDQSLTAGLPTVIPSFLSKTTWSVKATPKGELFSNGRQYNRLFYKFSGIEFTEPSSGFVVEAKSLVSFIQNSLASKLSLDKNETADLIDDLKMSLSETSTSGKYYKLSLVNRGEIDQYLPQTISPRPDSWNRNIILVRALDGQISIDEPDVEPVIRNGFTVVENGVVVK
jgi:hypothetical protein